jgi:hypothetical protein
MAYRTNWVFFPRSEEPPKLARDVVEVFRSAETEIERRFGESISNVVLEILRPGLEKIGFNVESGKSSNQKIRIPVLFGINGKIEKAFEADAWHREGKMVLEVEAGRGYTNNQFLKDLFQACMMHDVDYSAIAVRNLYKKSHNFERVTAFFETLYASGRLHLPLKGALLIGYSRTGD